MRRRLAESARRSVAAGRRARDTSDPLQAIRRCHDADQVLPGWAYRDPAVYEAEVERLFRREWIGVACAQSVPAPGDLFPLRIAGHALLVVRDADHEIRVFYNLCRHRGSLLADAPCRARAGRIVCPYHAWSFGLDGRLQAAPHFFRDGSSRLPPPAERAELGLIPLRSAVWRDVIFVNISGDAPPFAERIGPLERRIAAWTPAELRPLAVDEYRITVNWKLAVENFLDAYHLPVVHPQLGGGFSGALQMQDVELSEHIVGFVMPQGYGPGSFQEESSPFPPFPGLGAGDRLRVETFSIFPNTLLLVEPDNQQVIVLRPDGPALTHESFANYVVSDAALSPGLADERARWQRAAVEVNDQDVALLEGLQQARSMDVAGDTRPTPAWDRSVRRFQQLWAEHLLEAYGEPPSGA